MAAIGAARTKRVAGVDLTGGDYQVVALDALLGL